MSTPKKTMDITTTGSVVAVNTMSLMYLYYWLFNIDNEVKEEKTYNSISRKNLNVLNLEFKRSLYFNYRETEKTRGDIAELRNMLMMQSEEISDLREQVEKNERIMCEYNTAYNPLIVKTSIKQSGNEKSNDGSQTEKIH